MRENGLLQVNQLRLHYRTTHGVVQAADGVVFELGRRQALAMLDESGCGKSSLARAILHLLPRNVQRYDGHVLLAGRDLMALSEEDFRRDILWLKISLVMQAAMNALNPVLRVGDQVIEPLEVHAGVEALLCNPLRPDTQALLHAIPDADAANAESYRDIPPRRATESGASTAGLPVLSALSHYRNGFVRPGSPARL